MNTTIDWVEMQTGRAGPSMCDRIGHAWVALDDAPVPVQGLPACWHRCSGCGARRFLWMSAEARGDAHDQR